MFSWIKSPRLVSTVAEWAENVDNAQLAQVPFSRLCTIAEGLQSIDAIYNDTKQHILEGI